MKFRVLAAAGELDEVPGSPGAPRASLVEEQEPVLTEPRGCAGLGSTGGPRLRRASIPGALLVLPDGLPPPGCVRPGGHGSEADPRSAHPRPPAQLLTAAPLLWPLPP